MSMVKTAIPILTVSLLAFGAGWRSPTPRASEGQQPLSHRCQLTSTLMTQCQPSGLDGIVYCAICPLTSSRSGEACTIEMHVASWDLIAPLEEVDGWWILWSKTDEHWYFLYDGRHRIGGAEKLRHMDLCHPTCGLDLVGYTWQILNKYYDPRVAVVEGEHVSGQCIDCLQPTATPDPSLGVGPSRCLWKVYLPEVQAPTS